MLLDLDHYLQFAGVIDISSFDSLFYFEQPCWFYPNTVTQRLLLLEPRSFFSTPKEVMGTNGIEDGLEWEFIEGGARGLGVLE